MSEIDSNIPQEMITPAQRVRNDWRTLVETLSYKAIVNNIPFVGFLVLLCVFYISNSHRALLIEAQINKQDKLLKELRWKYMNEKTRLMQVKTEAQVMDNARLLGLRPSATPAFKINKK